jgi:ADP-dependent NAD(P)H-hydrate dehydratase / NAD(P)H-hydrate epimerase
MKIVSAAEMREIDRVTSEKFDVPSLTLMENAGTAVAQFVLSEYLQAKRITVVCGKGNNGGDGFVVARKLREAEKEVRVLLLTEPSELQGDAAQMFRRMGFMPVVAVTSDQLDSDIAQGALDVDLIVDAILGTGFRPPVTGLLADAIARINARALPVVAVDIPSGADAAALTAQQGPMARADAIVTFTAARPAHVFSALTTGPTIIAPIGSPPEAIVSSLKLNLIVPNEIAPLIGPRPAEANKGSYGHVMVIGGSLGKAGAAAMAGMSALRVGAGLSTVATAKSVLATVAGFHPELMTEALQETDAGTISLRALEYGYLDELTKGKTVLAIGPGISRNPETSEFVRTVVEKYRVPIVLDADGLNAFEGMANKLNGEGRSMVITPHPGEMARLTGLSILEVQKDRIGVARGFAKDHGIVVVLKGHRSLIAQPDGEVWVNTTGNPGMATGGTGDILTGMVAGMIAQNPKLVVEAVTAAVYLHGLAGDVTCETTGEQSLVATDLIGALPEAMRRVREAAKQGQVRFGG